MRNDPTRGPARRILVVDDDPQLLQLAGDVLEENGYRPLRARSTDEAFQMIREGKPDLILLDLWLPSIGGLEFCRQLRLSNETRSIPVIMLTVQDKESDKVRGLEVGADDYMTKPFGQKELLARIQALLRRLDRSQGGEHIQRAGDLAVDVERHEVLAKGKPVTLTPREFNLLVFLMRSRKKAQSRSMILSAVWGDDFQSDPSTIDVHIRNLRRKLGVHGEKIKTLLGFGYRFDG